MNGTDHDTDTNDATALTRLLEVSTTVLHQAVDLVDNTLTTDEQLTVHSQYMPGSTIGKHLRHARDHFVLLMDSLSTPVPHALDYDVRIRNTPMETSRQAARDALDAAIGQLEKIVPDTKMDEQITLHAVTPYPQVVQTTFGRELWFACLHAIHHWSMVRVIAGELGLKLEDSFGFAPSTLVHAASGSKAPLGRPKM
ncbi:uncharacterized protein FIBRA_03708 [Fibroporia radiculosa]|uniref:DinB-like domain-containing protein n=1 Tax=Fibroporia radiculosa TaxID=599839 RepID=J4HW50_9APHY|nr:uncharacterized protein FIBRA_03708 [Fibroporia radiculosa]CCM01647.1 predicted protein [Fibroporia radiculosa]